MTPAAPRRSVRTLATVGIALVLIVSLGVRWLRAPGARRPSTDAAPRSADLAPQAIPDGPSGARPRGSGLFGDPLARETADPRVRSDGDQDEDMPLPAARGHHRPRKEKRKRGGPGHAGDRHAIFSADLANPYPTPAEQALSDAKGLDGNAGTIALWVTPLWGENSVDDATLVRFGDDRVRLVKNVSFLRFEIVDRMGGHVGVGTSIAAWKVGEWHYVAATWDGRVIALYVDGGQMMAAAQTAPIDVAPDTPVFIGSSYPLGRPVAPAVMAGVTIRDRALTPSAIARRFEFGPRPTP